MERKVFDVSLYSNLFTQVIQRGLTKEEARRVVAFAATNDGVGAVTEKVSGEENQAGGYVFDVENRIRMQLTPPRHFYLQEEDAQTHRSIMVAPEHQWGNFKKDVLDLIDGWRRGTDRAGMEGIRNIFLDQTDNSLQEDETIIWGSPKAEEWEGADILKYNGDYGFLYVGKVIIVDGVKKLEVLDFKNDLDSRSYELLYEKMGEVNTDPLYADHPLVDKIKASFVRSKREWNVEAVWSLLGEVQKEVTGSGEIFNLPVEYIIALQDLNLHQRIRSEVAGPIGEWVAENIYNGVSICVIQDQIRQKFVRETVKLVARIKAEQSQSRQEKAYTTGRYVAQTRPLGEDEVGRYINVPNPAVLARYSGSSGNGCGSWGGSRSGGSGVSISSVAGLSKAFGGKEGLGETCEVCNKPNMDNHYHCPDCKKKYADETNTERTPVCGCGFEFGCGNSAEKEDKQEKPASSKELPKAA